MKGIQHFNEVYVDATKKIEQFHPRKIMEFVTTTFDRIQKAEKEKDKEEEEENNSMSYNIVVIPTPQKRFLRCTWSLARCVTFRIPVRMS